jgi:non-heme chloroperoxidase
VPVDSAPFRGVLPLPLSALRSALPVIGNPAKYRRPVTLTYEQFRFSFANAVSENEARRLYDAYPVAGSGIPLFQAATANINPFTEATADTKNPQRGPMLIITGEKDHIAPTRSPAPHTTSKSAIAPPPTSRSSRTAATPWSSTAAGRTWPKRP